jgi:beta-lactamase superfamily II metal-dependent hydrolase
MITRFFRSRIAAGTLLVGLAFGMPSACSNDTRITPPERQAPADPSRIEWTSETPARASVRYSYLRRSFDHKSYPEAKGRRDRAYELRHSVKLLDLRAGQHVYFQRVEETEGGPATYSRVDSFVAPAAPAQNLLFSTMIHIGFGDCHLLRMPTTGKRVLIDCGERGAAVSVRTYLTEHVVTHLDAMVGTHVHIDHMGGLVGSPGSGGDGVLEALPPGEFLDSPRKTFTLGVYDEVLRDLQSQRTPRIVVNRGDTSDSLAALQWDPAVHVTVLNSGTPPGYVLSGVDRTDINNDSIVLLFQYGDVRFILGGDAENAAEGSMLEAFPASTLEVEYYKVHHHGLPDASSFPWVNTLKPRVAFIPNTQLTWTPPNQFEGAISVASGRLAAAGADVYVIDDAKPLDRYRRSGVQYNVSFVTDGRSYEVRVEQALQKVSPPSAETLECLLHDPDLRGLFESAAEPAP